MGKQSSSGAHGKRVYLFGITLFVPVSLLLLLIIVLNVSGCGGKATSSPGKTVTKIPVTAEAGVPTASRILISSRPSLPTPSPTSESSVEYTRTLWFVWDRTASMGKYCTGTNSDLLQRLPAFITRLGFVGEQERKSSGDKASLYVGLLQITGAKPGICAEVIPPTLVDTIIASPTLREKLLDPAKHWKAEACSKVTRKPSQENGHSPKCTPEKENGYAFALESIWDKEKNVKSKRSTSAIILFTDGTHITKNFGPECEEERTRLALWKLKGNGIKTNRIRTLAVLCNNASGEEKKTTEAFWQACTNGEGDISYLMAEPERFTDMVKDILGDFMPRRGGWVFEGHPYTFTVPGEATKVIVNVVELPTHSYSPNFWLHRGTTGKPPSRSPKREEWPTLHHFVEPIDGPVDNCRPFRFTMATNQGRIGYAWHTFESPHVSFTAESNFSSVNDTPVPITFYLRSKAISYGQLEDRRDCYKVRLLQKDIDIGSIGPQRDSETGVPQEGKFIENHGQLESHWVWMPGQGNDVPTSATEQISATFELVAATQETPSQETPLALMDVPLTRTLVPQLKGNAITVEEKPMKACPGGGGGIPNDKYTWIFEFGHVIDSSQVSLTIGIDKSAKGPECHDENHDEYQCESVHLSYNPTEEQEEFRIDNPVIFEAGQNGVAGAYTVSVHSYVYNVCKLQAITFTWTTFGLTWECSVRRNKNGDISECIHRRTVP